jgi:hypothetical protein
VSRILADPGELVVCVDACFPAQIWEWVTEIPIAGEVYTVVKLTQAAHGVTGLLGLAYELEEFRNCAVNRNRPLFFSCYRFRRLEHEEEEEREDSLSDILGRGDTKEFG